MLLMSIYSNLLAIDCTPTSIGRRARLPLTIAGLLLTAQAQAFLPTPASLVTTGELALDTADNNSASKSQSTEPTLMAYTEPNNTIKPSIVSNTAKTSSTSNNQSANTQQLLASWRQQAETENLAQHTTWRRLLYFLMIKRI